MTKFLRYITFIAIICIFSIFYSNRDVKGVEYSTMAMLVFNIFFSLQDPKRRFIFLAFQITFAVFLLGQDIASLLETRNGLFSRVIEEEFINSTILHIYLTLFTSLIAVYLGYALNEQDYSITKKNQVDLNNKYNIKLREYSKKFMNFFCIFAIAITIEKAIFVQATGYVEYYTSFHSILPSFFYRFETLYEISLFLYLATLPRWKECRIALLIYFVIGLVSLGYGQRNGFVLNTLFIAIYFSIRHLFKFYGKEEVWINKKRIVTIIIALPFLMYFLYTFGSTRVDEKAKSFNNPIDNTLAFFHQQGGSIRLIGYEKELDDNNQFPKDAAPYTFGYLIDLYQQNAIFKAFKIYPSYAPLTVERAMKGHNFGETITYLYDHRYYFAGMGLGSCYIAEVHHDFGLIGVFLISFLYGLIFTLVYKYASRNPWSLFFGLTITMYILYAPRSAALLFLNQILAPSTIIFILFIVFLMKKYKNKSSKVAG